ncbi:MAG: hypothetical protein ACRDVD_09465 [Acidimicrobiia bacterium]
MAIAGGVQPVDGVLNVRFDIDGVGFGRHDVADRQFRQVGCLGQRRVGGASDGRSGNQFGDCHLLSIVDT